MYMLLCWGEKPIFNTVILIVIILEAADGITIVSRLYMLCGQEKRHLIQTLKITILLPLLEMLGILNTRHYFLQQSWRNCGQTHHLFLYNSINACNVILSMQTMQFYQCRQWNSISVSRSLLLLKLPQDL